METGNDRAEFTGKDQDCHIAKLRQREDIRLCPPVEFGSHLSSTPDWPLTKSPDQWREQNLKPFESIKKLPLNYDCVLCLSLACKAPSLLGVWKRRDLLNFCPSRLETPTKGMFSKQLHLLLYFVCLTTTRMLFFVSLLLFVYF